MLKRLFDLLASGSLLLLISPFFLVLIIISRLTLGSPVFFFQARPGHKGVVFKMIKFRTMTYDTGASGELLPDSERLTPFGRFLRDSSLDELPELFNVIKGDMSLVGPRPLLVDYLPLYNQRQARRHDVRPGITGWAQINGRNSLAWEEKFELDIWYVENRSFFLDLKICILTLFRIVKRNGVGHGDQPTMPRFTGTKDRE